MNECFGMKCTIAMYLQEEVGFVLHIGDGQSWHLPH